MVSIRKFMFLGSWSCPDFHMFQVFGSLPNVVNVPAGLPKANDGVVPVLPPVAAPKLPVAPPPNNDGFAAPPASPPAFWNEKPPDAGGCAPDVACVFPKRLGLLAAGVLDPPPNRFPPELAAPPPKRDGAPAGVLVPAFVLFALPKRLDVPGVAAAPPNRGLFGVLLLLLVPKLNAMVREFPAAACAL